MKVLKLFLELYVYIMSYMYVLPTPNHAYVNSPLSPGRLPEMSHKMSTKIYNFLQDQKIYPI